MAPATPAVAEPASLSISCVTYQLDCALLSSTIQSLAASCAAAKASGALSICHLYLIDNGPTAANYQQLLALKNNHAQHFDAISVLTGHGNLGYGRGNNLAIFDSHSDYHLVLNPDVILPQDNITTAIDFMRHNTEVGLLAPDAKDEFGFRQYIAKRKPSFLVLFARAFNVGPLRAIIARQLNSYEYRDLIPAAKPVDIALASGCYMFLRRDCVQAVGGFDADFFMYFEDFNLSQRVKTIKRVVHHPALNIVHYGGGAAKKGIKHFCYFLSSYIKFIVKTKG